MLRQKKQSTPRRRARKNEQDGHLQFLIFETLSQRFLQNIFRNFQFFQRKKNLTPASRCPKATSPLQELEIWERSDPNF